MFKQQIRTLSLTRNILAFKEQQQQKEIKMISCYSSHAKNVVVSIRMLCWAELDRNLPISNTKLCTEVFEQPCTFLYYYFVSLLEQNWKGQKKNTGKSCFSWKEGYLIYTQRTCSLDIFNQWNYSVVICLFLHQQVQHNSQLILLKSHRAVLISTEYSILERTQETW